MGVPPMRVFDSWAFEILSALLGEPPATVLETAARLRFTTTGGCVALVGPGAKLVGNDQVHVAPCVVDISGDWVVEPSGRAFLATPNGWLSPLPFGGANCQRITNGQELLPIQPQSIKTLHLDPSANNGPSHPCLLRVIGDVPPGEWTVQADSDRRGIRLRNPRVTDGPPGIKPSRPCFVGTCQMTPDGTLIIHGPDGPTLGGYHQVGTVTAAHLPLLAHLRPGNSVLLRSVGMEEALRARRRQREELEQWRRWIDSNR